MPGSVKRSKARLARLCLHDRVFKTFEEVHIDASKSFLSHLDEQMDKLVDLLYDNVVVDAIILREDNGYDLLEVALLEVVVQLVHIQFQVMHEQVQVVLH